MTTFTNYTGAQNDTDKVIAILQKHLATTFDLYSQAKQAHWNLKGAHFIALHELFDSEAGNVLGYVDTIAERITALGGYPRGYAAAAVEATLLEKPADSLVKDLEWVSYLLKQYQTYSKELYADIAVVGELDPATQDLLIEVARGIDKGIYFLMAHVEG